MKGDKKIIWVEAGYRRFASYGEIGLTVEAIARDLGRNKSSFYHYFGELQVLKADMLQHHLEASNSVGKKIADAEVLDPDALSIVVEHKADFLFHKQLKLATGQEYKDCYDKAFEYVRGPLLSKLREEFDLKDKQLFSEALLTLVTDNFLLRIQEATLTIPWLRDYLKELRDLTRHIN